MRYLGGMRWFFLVLLLLPTAAAAEDHPERWYQERWCAEHGGEAEVVLENRTRVDCLTDRYAVEVDFGPKWAQAIGQALYYAERTGRRPGIVLVLEDGGERYLRRLREATEGQGLEIRVWVVEP